jgi:hypothetical protein
MATQVTYSGDGAQTDFDLTFPFQDQADIYATVNSASVSYTWVTGSRIRITPAPAQDAAVRIYRKTDMAAREVDFTDGSVLTEEDLDRSNIQVFYRLQEVADDATALTARALRAPDGESLDELPAAASRSGLVLCFDEDGQPELLEKNSIKGDPGGNVMSAFLFTEFGDQTIAEGTSTIRSTGYSSVGVGAAFYIADDIANAGLAIAHPRFCKADAAGRYFRLSGINVTAEQGGALGTPGTNDRPAFQAAVNYAKAVGIRHVTVENEYSAFEWWAPPAPALQSPGGYIDVFSLTQNGDFLTISAGQHLDLRRAVVSLKGYAGGSLASQTQAAPVGNANGYTVWRGSAVAIIGGTQADPDAFNIRNVSIANATFDGGWARIRESSGGAENAHAELSHKGLRIQDTAIGEFYAENVEFRNYSAECWYFGMMAGLGVEANGHPRVTLLNCRGRGSNQSSFNPAGAGKFAVIGGEFGDATYVLECLGAGGHTFVNTRFYDGWQASFLGGAGYDGFDVYGFSIPTDAGDEVLPPLTRMQNVTFDAVEKIFGANLLEGAIKVLDGEVIATANLSSQCRTVRLKIDHWVHKYAGTAALTIQGPANGTTLFNGGGSPYIQPVKNCDFELSTRVTPHALASNRQVPFAVAYSGLIEQDTVAVRITESEAAQLGGAFGSNSDVKSMPRITVVQAGLGVSEGSGTPSGGVIFSADLVGGSPYTFSPYNPTTQLRNTGAAGVATIAMGMPFSAPYSYAFGQRIRLEWESYSTAGSIYLFPKDGTRLRLNADRRLAAMGDYLILEWNAYTGKWHEVEFCSATAADTGWTAGTGTALKGAFATYGGTTMSAGYVQAEAQAADDAAKAASQRVLALEQALRTARIID